MTTRDLAMAPLLASMLAAQALPLAAAQNPTSSQDRDDDVLRAATEQAVAWIERQAKPVAGAKDAVLFPDSAESTEAPTAVAYGGTAGVLIFLESAAVVLEDARAFATAALRATSVHL